MTAAALFIGAGCGSDDEQRPAREAASPQATVRVTETDFAIDPAEARVHRAGTVRIAVVNRGQVAHALAIDTPDGVVKTGTLAPGESGRVDADLDAGTYTWFCPVGDHRARGMEGKITVEGRSQDDEPSGNGFGY